MEAFCPQPIILSGTLISKCVTFSVRDIEGEENFSISSLSYSLSRLLSLNGEMDFCDDPVSFSSLALLPS